VRPTLQFSETRVSQEKHFHKDELIIALGVSAKITVIPTVASNFLDYDGAFKAFYTNLLGFVKNNHIFTCGGDDDELIMKNSREQSR
jgi:thioredoxin reductase